jgi:hypothetical protein
MYLQVGLENASWEEKAYAGLALVKSVELEIGGQRIDKQYGDWMYIWNELSLGGDKREGFDDMVGGKASTYTTTATALKSIADQNKAIDAILAKLTPFLAVSGTAVVPTTGSALATAVTALTNAPSTTLTNDANTLFDNVTTEVNKIALVLNEIQTATKGTYSGTTFSSYPVVAAGVVSFSTYLGYVNTYIGTTLLNVFNAANTVITSISVVPTSATAMLTAVTNAVAPTTGTVIVFLTAQAKLPTSSDFDTAATAANTAGQPKTTLYIPLEFWFCRNPGLALPLIALQYHEVKVNLELNTAEEVGVKPPTYVVLPAPNDVSGAPASLVAVASAVPKMTVAALWVDYVFLDTDERRRFAQLSHEYLIEQLQFTGEENVTGSSNKVKLNFNHPVKELVWVMQQSASPFGCYDNSGTKVVSGAAQSNGYVRTGMNLTETANIQLNGHDRFAVREGKYFNRVQPFQHHTCVPANKGINVYSFALKPEEHQPSGTLNFSRIDSAVLNVKALKNADAKLDPSKIRVYAVNYNVLRVMSGMGGLAYSN